MIFHQTAMQPATLVDREILRFIRLLESGVDLFFVLSGFLITGILLDTKASSHYFRNFYARRFLRIFPLYYAVLFLGLEILPFFSHPKSIKWGHVEFREQLWYWLFLSNWWIALRGFGPRNGLIDLSWTLSIEEQFYLVWPFVVLVLKRMALIWVCLGMVVVAFLVRLCLVVLEKPPLWIHMMTPARLDPLALGALVCLVGRDPLGLLALRRIARPVTVVAVLILMVMVWLPESLAFWIGFRVICGGTVLAVLYAALLVMAMNCRPGGMGSRVFENAGLRCLGVYSYALYLVHNPTQAVIRDLIYGPDRFPRWFGSPLPGQILFYIVATAPALGIAWLSWRYFEEPILRLKRYFPSERRATVSTEAIAEVGPGSQSSVLRGSSPGEPRGG